VRVPTQNRTWFEQVRRADAHKRVPTQNRTWFEPGPPGGGRAQARPYPKPYVV